MKFRVILDLNKMKMDALDDGGLFVEYVVYTFCTCRKVIGIKRHKSRKKSGPIELLITSQMLYQLSPWFKQIQLSTSLFAVSQVNITTTTVYVQSEHLSMSTSKTNSSELDPCTANCCGCIIVCLLPT